LFKEPIRIFTSIEDVPKKDWEQVVSESNLFLSLKYLSAVSQTLSQEMQYLYVLVNANKTPIVAGVFQIATFTYKKGAQTNLLLKLFQDCKNKDDSVSIRGLVCGNIFATGTHGFAHSEAVSFKAASELMASAAKQIRGMKKYENAFSIQLFKDFNTDLSLELAVFEDFKYRSFQADVTMVLPIPKDWKTFQRYLDTMKAKYRTKANSSIKKASALQLVSFSALEIAQHLDRLQELFSNVQQQSEYSYGETYPQAFKALKEKLGEAFICKGAFLDDKLVGFSTAFLQGTTLEASYVGLDYSYNTTYAVYERLLYNYVEEAIMHKATLLHLGRTSELIKSALGATPQPMTLYAKHTSKFKNALLKPILEKITPSEFELRTPFKASFYKEAPSMLPPLA
tara:strand:- start:25804 stop:26994 length:1191 start_codon:yes stop_codon:yes gene_type:complete